MINLNALRVFHVVASKQNLARAAESLFISQPAVSNTLKKFQAEKGVQLFYKVGRTLALTEHGEALFALTTRLFAVEMEIKELLEGMHRSSKRTLHVGLATIYERFGIGEIKQQFSEIDSNIAISIHSGNSKTMLGMLQDRTIDIAIAGNLFTYENFTTHFYREHEIFLVVPKGHRLYGKSHFSSEDIRHERMVLKEAGSSVRETLNSFFSAHAIVPNIVMELSNLDSMLSLVGTERCITFLPDMSITDTALPKKGFSKARCKDSPLLFSTYIIWRSAEEYDSVKKQTIEKLCALQNVASGRVL